MVDILQCFLELLFPSRRHCPVCLGEAGVNEVCHLCSQEMTTAKGLMRCPVCGRYRQAAGAQTEFLLCRECESQMPAFLGARSAGPYHGKLRDAIHLFKFKGHRSLDRFFGQMAARLYTQEPLFSGAEAIVPVPASLDNLAVRGYNQAELLAVEVGKITGLPVYPCLTRIRHTPSQSKLTGTARKDLISGVFSVEKGCPLTKILLIDDIITTGATAGECTKTLLKAGSTGVMVLTLASGIYEKLY